MTPYQLRDNIYLRSQKRSPLGPFRQYLFEHFNDAVFISDVKTKKIIDVNQRAISLFGYSKNEFQKMSIFNLRKINKMGEARKLYEDFLVTGETTYQSEFYKSHNKYNRL